MAKRRTRARGADQNGHRTDTSGWASRAGLDAGLVPRLLVGGVNGAEVLAIGALQLARNVLMTVATGAAELGTLVVSRSAGAARGVVQTTSELVGGAAGVATNTVRTTVTAAKDVGAEIGQAIRGERRRTTSSQTRSHAEAPAAAPAEDSHDGSQQKRGRRRKAESPAA
jgi:hypothetical protein